MTRIAGESLNGLRPDQLCHQSRVTRPRFGVFDRNQPHVPTSLAEDPSGGNSISAVVAFVSEHRDPSKRRSELHLLGQSGCSTLHELDP